MTEDPKDLAVKAVEHILRTLREYPERFYLLGDGTESYTLLTEAYAALHDKPVGEVEQKFRPPAHKWEHYLADRKYNDKLLTKVKDNQDVTVTCETPAAISFDSYWLETGQFIEPVASLRSLPDADGKSDRELINSLREFAKRTLEEAGLMVE